MRTLLYILAALNLAAQDKAPQEKPAQEATAEKKAAQTPAEEPAKAEQPFQGEFEFGTRWNQGIKGSLDSYRSVVNLGEGPRLVSWDTRFDSPTLKYLKRARFYGAGWGGDPTAWLRFSAEDQRLYRLTVDHRTTAYFNSLPSFANPLLERGILTSQRSFDTRRRLTEAEIALFPASRWIPYFGFTQDRGVGRGTTSFVSDANEYPVLNNLDDRTQVFRGGLRIEMRRVHATIEQGGIRFRDDQRLLASGERNPGNRPNPILGQTLVLTDLLQAYAVRGTSVFSRGLFSAQPVSWIDLSGSFQFSQPRNDVTYSQANQGRFVDLDSLLFFNSQNLRLLAAAKQPHLTANAGAEFRPLGRVRLMQSWTTDRLHNSSAVADTPLADRLEWSYSQQQTEVVVEPVSRLTLRGGYRYVWGDGLSRSSLLGLQPFDRAQLRRHVGLAGAGFRVTDRFAVNSDLELARSSRVLFRTSLSDYERIRVRGRHQIRKDLQMYGTLQYLNNSNPPSLSRFEFRSQQGALGLHWLPGSGQGLEVLGEYGRSSVRSDLFYLVPQFLADTERSFYRENAHTITGMVSVPVAIGWTWHVRLSAGGSMFRSTGSRPMSFYQPVAKFAAPVHRHLDVTAEYRWYGVSQTFYVFEGFRSHQGFVGVRVH